MNRVRFASSVALAVLLAVTACQQKPKAEKLATPEPVLASAGIDNATIMWKTVKNAESYQVVVDDGAPISASGISITIQNLKSSTTYSLKMKAVAPSGSTEWLDSDFCAPISFTTAGKTVLATPVLTVSNIVSGGFTVSWKAVKNAEKYVYKVGDGAEQETTQTTFTADGLKNSTKYTVKVKAIPPATMADVAVESEWGTVDATTAAPAKLSAPVLTSSAIHTNGFTVSWAAVPNAGKYIYKLDGGTEQTTTSLSAAFNSLTAKSNHTVQVRAAASDANAGNYTSSDWASIQVTTLDLVVLATPQLKSENILATEFTITWPAVEHAAKYMCSLDGAAFTAVTGTSVKYDGLHTETAYNVKVYAVPADSETGTYKQSPVASIDVTTKQGESPDDKGGSLSDFDENPIF